MTRIADMDDFELELTRVRNATEALKARRATTSSIGTLLDISFAMGTGSLYATIIADPDGIREAAFIAWAAERGLHVEIADGIRESTLRTLYIRFPGNPHPIASLLVPAAPRPA